jgi:putative SbcD/Mre11-related phosphoesterase
MGQEVYKINLALIIMNYKFVDKAVFFPEEKILVIADLHLGYEENLNIALPRSQFREIIDNLDKIFDYLDKSKEKIKEVVILGDLKHSFSENIDQEWGEIRRLFDFLKEKAGKIVLIRGNHDNYLASIASRYEIEVRDYYIKGDKAFIHGDKKILEIEDKKIKLWILGHFHPAIRLEEKAKREIYKCFLKGGYKDKEIVILPSFFPLVEGQDVSKYDIEDTHLAYNFNLKEFSVYVPVSPEEILEFGLASRVGKLG